MFVYLLTQKNQPQKQPHKRTECLNFQFETQNWETIRQT